MTTNSAKISYTDATKVGLISVTQAVDLDTMESDVSDNNAKVTELTPESNTGTVINLANYTGNYMNMSSANATTTYTTTGQVLGGFAVIRINAATQPLVTGATLINGSDFIADTDMHMTVQFFGATTQFFFVEL